MSVALSEHLPLLASAPDGIQKLRGLILELAVRGKLVPQDPDDEPASELLNRIAQERARLEAEGLSKKSKPMLAVKKDERLFEMPLGWVWARFADVTSYIQRGKGPDYADQSDYVVVSQKCVRWNGLDLSQARWITPGSFAKYDPIRLLRAGDVLWNSTGTGTIGRAVVVPTLAPEQRMVADSHVTVVRSVLISPKYLWRWIQSPSVQTEIEGSASGSTNQIELATSTVTAHPIPLPPLAEQHRIVAKVDELMALCDRLEAEQTDAEAAHAKLVETLLGTLTLSTDAAELAANWLRLAEHFDTLFTTESSLDALKQTILQLAVMGKLVPQDPNDEPASELLKWITQERVQLEAEGIRKQSKPLPPLGENEQPFVLPDGWEWVKVGSIAEIRGGKRLPAGHNYSPVPTEHVYIQVTNMKNGTILHDDLKYIDKATYAEIARYTISTDDLYVTIAGTIGQVGCVPRSFDGMNLTENAAKLSFSHLDRLGLRMILSAPYVKSQFLDKANQQAQPKLALRNIADTVIALPPRDEQHRIVAKVDELMALCDCLKTDLGESRTRQARLSATLIESALQAA